MWTTVLLIAVLAVCCLTDLLDRKIYNGVLFPSMAAALFLNGLQAGWMGVLTSVGGCIVGGLILLVPYFLGGMGAGDVKLLATVGTIKGTAFVLYASVYMGLAGGAMALLWLAAPMLRMSTWRTTLYTAFSWRYGGSLPANHGGRAALKQKLPYGLAIAAGAVWMLLEKGGFRL